MQNKLLILLLLLGFSCQKTDVLLATYEIDPALKPYVDSFVTEAKKRNIEVKQENLIMKFGATTIEICGQYIKDNKGQRSITINPSASCWKDAPEQNREALVFHELGHCFLNRLHRDDHLPDGSAASIMSTSNNGPYEPCIYPIDGSTTCNKTARRDYYIDELFNEKTPVPNWAK